MKYRIPKEKVEKLESYLKKLQVEMVMSNYTNGWYKQRLVEKINSVKKRLKIIKND